MSVATAEMFRCGRSRRAAGPFRQWMTLAALVLAGLAGSATFSPAAQESTHSDQDLSMVVDPRWPGNGYGGYFPIRIRLTNRGPARTLNVVFKNSGLQSTELPTVQRTVRVDQQATVQFTLSIPMVSINTEGVVRVYDENGAELKGLVSRHSLPDYGGPIPRSSLLVISTDGLDEKLLQPFEDAAATESAFRCAVAAAITTGSPSMSSPHAASIVERDHVVLAADRNLPVNWIDYSGVDLVAVAWRDWNSNLSTTERQAILKWTAAGGVLMIFGTGRSAADLPELNASLRLSRPEVAQWSPANDQTYRPTKIITSAELRGSAALPHRIRPDGEPAEGATPDEPPAVSTASTTGWKITPQTFSQRDWTFGRIYVYPDNPFPGTAENWAWWLTTLPKDLSHWPDKMGMSSRDHSGEFLNFLIPGVGSVPVIPFLILITLFTVIIGPLNYYWLLKRRRLSLMVVTVPLIAGVTCLLLFTYGLFADGFSIRSRVHSLTWLDQQRNSAVAISRLSLYAPFAPSAGIAFSSECAVLPIWNPARGFEGGTLDWSNNDQRMTSGWFRSQTWTQFQTIDQRDERGRLDYTPPRPDAKTLTVSNGLSWDLGYLAVCVSKDRWFAGEKVPAGAKAELKLVTNEEVASRFHQAQEASAWKFPSEETDSLSKTATYNGGTPYIFRGTGNTGLISLRESLLYNYSSAASLYLSPRREILDWREGRMTTQTVPHLAATTPHYWALCDENPGLQLGVSTSLHPTSLMLLFGTF